MQETEQTGVRCSHKACGALNRPAARYCATCGRPLLHTPAPAGDETFGKLFALVFFAMIFFSTGVTCMSTFV